MKITRIYNTCFACPSQWEGETDLGQEVYARYRWGYLSVDIGGIRVFGKPVGGKWDGVMNYEELKAITTGVFEWPEFEDAPNDI